jgi:biopolymer transport protein ExbD
MRFHRTTRILRGQWDALPFLCVLFPLAFFLLFHQYLVLPRGVLIELPTAAEGPGLDPAVPRVVVAVDGLGRMYFENQFVQEAELSRRLTERRSQSRELPIVVVQADRRVAHGVLVRVGELARQAGLQRVYFVARPQP